MSMKTLRLSTHWTGCDVYQILELLSQLEVSIKTHYAEELDDFYQEMTMEADKNQLDFFNDEIPF